MKKKYFTVFCTIGIYFLSAIPLFADIYKYIDSNGVLHFTNVPVSSDYRLFVTEKPQNAPIYYSSDKYDRLISKASKRHGIDFPLVKAMIKVESNFNPKAVSRKGAKGLMQIMPGNYKNLNIKDPFNPWENIMGGTRYFKQLLKRFEGKLPLALAAYNAGPKTVEQYKKIPPYPETEKYVEEVMKYYIVFK